MLKYFVFLSTLILLSFSKVQMVQDMIIHHTVITLLLSTLTISAGPCLSKDSYDISALVLYVNYHLQASVNCQLSNFKFGKTSADKTETSNTWLNR